MSSLQQESGSKKIRIFPISTKKGTRFRNATARSDSTASTKVLFTFLCSAAADATTTIENARALLSPSARDVFYIECRCAFDFKARNSREIEDDHHTVQNREKCPNVKKIIFSMSKQLCTANTYQHTGWNTKLCRLSFY